MAIEPFNLGWRDTETGKKYGPQWKGGQGGIPRLEVPKYDPQRVAALQQEQMMPQMESLRRQIRDVGARRYANLVEERETIRGAVRGYGEALPGIQAGAYGQASALYRPEHAQAEKEAMSAYEEAMNRYNQAMEEKEKLARRSRHIGGETYAQAQAGMPSIFAPGGGALRLASPAPPAAPATFYSYKKPAQNRAMAYITGGYGALAGEDQIPKLLPSIDLRSEVQAPPTPAIYSPEQLLAESFGRF